MLGLLSSAEFIQFGFTNPHAIRVGECFGPYSDQTVARRGLKRVLTRAQYIFMPKNLSCIILCEMYMKFICTVVVDETEK